MRRWTRYMLLMPVLAIAQALSSCSTIDGPDDNSPVEASLAFTVSSAAGATTRMADVVVQEQGNGRSYRGLGDVYMIPFAITGETVNTSDHPSRLFENATQTPYLKTAGDYGGFYLYNSFTIMRGINAFLVYGKASTSNMTVPSGVTSKAYFGSLQVPESDLLYPDLTTLRFSPDPIYKGTDAPTAASILAGYLSNIANTPGWSTTTDETLKLLYKVFTGQENDGNVMVMAGASVNVMALANSLYALMSQLTFTGSEATIQTGILNRIKSYTADGLTLTNNNLTGTEWRLTAVKVNGEDYPSSLDLPDGAAALRWEKISETEYGFIPQTVTTTLANVNNINRFCYPPELFYYANSRINTTNSEESKSEYYGSSNDWDDVIGHYEYENGTVSGNTKGIAIRKPLEYAVGRLKMTLQELAVDKLNDDAGKAIPVKNASNNPSFPLTGIIICNQHPVGYDFKPVLVNGAVTHSDDHFIYDSQVGTDCCLRQATTATLQEIPIPSTLVLQTYGDETVSGEEVVIALEFRNDSGEDFRGKSGIIYQGTKFYLMGVITPVDGTANSNVPADVLKRVFTRDYVTTVSTKVESLANAYNVLPNILGGRLELGVELTPNWIQAETTNVILE